MAFLKNFVNLQKNICSGALFWANLQIPAYLRLIASPFPNKINWNIDVKANKTIQNVLFLKNFTKLRYEGVFFINSLLANKYSVQQKHFFYFCLRGKKIAYLMNRNYVYDKTQSKAKT